MNRSTLFFAGCALFTAAVASVAQSPEEQLAAASALYDAHKYADAAQKLAIFLVSFPRNDKAGVAAFVLGRCRTELKQYDKAIPAYEKAVASKDTSVTNQAEIGLGEAAMNTHQYEKAAAALDTASKGAMRPDQASYVYLWLGQADYQLKRYAPADEAFNKVIRDFPRGDALDTAYYGAALTALKLDRADAARLRLRDLTVRFGRSAVRPQAMLMIGQIDLEAKRYPQARSEFRALLDDSQAKSAGPELLDSAQDGLIQALLELKQYDEAATYLQQAIDRLPAADPQKFRAALSLGNCRYRQQHYEPAHAAYDLASRSTEASVAAEGAYWAANATLQLKRPGDAAIELDHFVTNYPGHELAAKAAIKAAQSYTAAGQSGPALHDYRLVVSRYGSAPEAAEARKALGELVGSVNDPVQLAAALKGLPPAARAAGTLRLARLYLDAKKPQDAAAALADLMTSRPSGDIAAEAQYLLGITCDDLKKPAPAAAAFGESLRMSPAAPWAADAGTRLAWLSLDLKQPSSAERAAQAALQAHPDRATEQQARLALAQADLDQRKWDEALAACKALLSANPDPATAATALYTQAWVAEKQGHSNDAAPIWDRLVRGYPRGPYTAEALIRLGDAAMKVQKYDDARDRYAKLLSDLPGSPRVEEAHFKLGSALYNGDKAADAAKEFDAAAQDRSGGDYVPEALYWAGVSYAKLDNKPEAIGRLEKLVASYPHHARVPNARIRLAALKAGGGT